MSPAELNELAKRHYHFAFTLAAFASAIDEQKTLYHSGHHNVEEQLHDIELTHQIEAYKAEIERDLPQAGSDLMFLRLQLAQKQAEVGV